MEILSPVGGQMQLIAAVRSGANAVYLGLQNFNARRNADNFDKNSLKEAISYCHARNVKVYITLNTLVKEQELENVISAIKDAAYAGADALIIQDLAVYSIAKKVVPQMPLHASTQMSIHNSLGVQALEKLGFSRVVPARELSLKELEIIRKASDIELEVFVHGALCMCISGQCYLSSVLGQRSANRGLCAQPCRLDFKTENRDHALSLKDLSVIKDIKELEKVGINSAKIEGRMKRPEYVAAATEACKKALNGEDFDLETLQAIFSRSGFTDGYIKNKRNSDMFGYRTKDDVVSAAPVLKTIENKFRNEMPLVPVDMQVEITSSKPCSLTVTEGENTVTVIGQMPEKAISREIDYDWVMRSVKKCGGTPYYINNLECNIEKGLSLAVSEINNLRKSALEKLENIKGMTKEYIVNDYTFDKPSKTVKNELAKQSVYARFEKEDQIVENVDKIILDYEKIYENPTLCQKYKGKLIAELPLLLFDEKDAKQKLKELKNLGIKEVYAQNLYAVHLAKQMDFEIYGGYALNIINSISLDEYKKLGVKNAEISFEISLDSFDKLNKTIPCGLIAYGKMPLMTFRNCPVKDKVGCGSCKCKAKILDRYNNEFTVLCKDRKYGRLLNPQPIYMADKIKMMKNADYLTVFFTDEDHSECLKIINKIKSKSEFDSSFTRGLYFKEIY